MNWFVLLWRRIVHEWCMWRHGWHYTEKPMLGKKLYKLERTFDLAKSPDVSRTMILFKREIKDWGNCERPPEHH